MIRLIGIVMFSDDIAPLFAKLASLAPSASQRVFSETRGKSSLPGSSITIRLVSGSWMISTRTLNGQAGDFLLLWPPSESKVEI
jgi:hypothetical protein